MPIVAPSRVLAIPGAGSLAAISKSPRPPPRGSRRGSSFIGGRRVYHWGHARRPAWAPPREWHRLQPARRRARQDLPGRGSRGPWYAHAMQQIEVCRLLLQPGGIWLLPDDVVAGEWF